MDDVCRERHLDRAVSESRRSSRDGGRVHRDGTPLASNGTDQGSQARRNIVALPDSRDRDQAYPVRRSGGTVYAIVNRATGRVYVGVTAKAVGSRMRNHHSLLRMGRHSQLLQADWSPKEADTSWCCEVLEALPYKATELDRLARETAWMMALQDAGVTLYNSVRYSSESRSLIMLSDVHAYRARRAGT